MTTEIELSEEFDHEKLLNLFQLYLLAIQYYSLNDPPKAKPYKIRMENYFTEKDTLKNLIKFVSIFFGKDFEIYSLISF